MVTPRVPAFALPIAGEFEAGEAMSDQLRDRNKRTIEINGAIVEYELSQPPPLQGSGRIAGREFYFIAKHSNWSFEVANDFGELPSDVGGNTVFTVQSRHNDAGFMPMDEASKIIEDCARLYLEVTAPRLKRLGS